MFCAGHATWRAWWCSPSRRVPPHPSSASDLQRWERAVGNSRGRSSHSVHECGDGGARQGSHSATAQGEIISESEQQNSKISTTCKSLGHFDDDSILYLSPHFLFSRYWEYSPGLCTRAAPGAQHWPGSPELNLSLSSLSLSATFTCRHLNSYFWSRKAASLGKNRWSMMCESQVYIKQHIVEIPSYLLSFNIFRL